MHNKSSHVYFMLIFMLLYLRMFIIIILYKSEFTYSGYNNVKLEKN